MNVVLYSTGCVNCRLLESKLMAHKIPYKKETDMKVMEEKEFMSVPILEVDGRVMNFGAANQWLNNYKE